MVILDIAVPRDFDPRIHDGDRTCLFNIDDLKRIQEATLADRRRHVGPAEALVEQETQRFVKEWRRRRHGPVIERLTRDLEAKREEVVRKLFDRLNGRLSEEDRKYIEYAFVKLQNQFLHGPISAWRRTSRRTPPAIRCWTRCTSCSGCGSRNGGSPCSFLLGRLRRAPGFRRTKGPANLSAQRAAGDWFRP